MSELSKRSRVYQPFIKTKHLLKLFNRFWVVLALTIGILLLPTPEGLSTEGHRALAASIFTSAILALQPVSLPIAGLMVPVAQVVLGVATTTQAFETFSRPVIFLILGGLFLAEALRNSGLTRRLAFASILASGGSVRNILLSLMSIAALFSMWVENTATAAILIPVALTICRGVTDSIKARRLLVLLVLGIAYSASLGGMVTIMGSSSNAVASGFLAQIRVWTFIDWIRFGLPAFLLIFPLTWWILLRLVPMTIESLDMDLTRQEVNKMGSISPPEREILLTMVVAIFFWITGPFIEPILGFPPTTMSPTIVAITAVAYLSLRGFINWDQVKGVSWGFLFTIGAGLSLGETLNRSGATEWLSSLITPIISRLPLFLTILLLVFLSALLTNVMNNATVVAIFIPILISVANFDPSYNIARLALPLALATTFGYSLPSASGRMALIASTGIIDRKEMFRCGLILTVISSIVLASFFYVLALLKWI